MDDDLLVIFCWCSSPWIFCFGTSSRTNSKRNIFGYRRTRISSTDTAFSRSRSILNTVTNATRNLRNKGAAAAFSSPLGDVDAIVSSVELMEFWDARRNDDELFVDNNVKDEWFRRRPPLHDPPADTSVSCFNRWSSYCCPSDAPTSLNVAASDPDDDGDNDFQDEALDPRWIRRWPCCCTFCISWRKIDYKRATEGKVSPLHDNCKFMDQ